MSETPYTLTRFREIEDRARLANALHGIARSEGKAIVARYHPGVVRRLDPLADPEESLEKAQRYIEEVCVRDAMSGESCDGAAHRIERFVIHKRMPRNEAARIIGAATVYHGLRVGAPRVALPPRFANRIPGMGYRYAEPATNVTAWVTERNGDALKEVYEDLVDRVSADGGPVWTVEPVTSSGFVQWCIENAGLRQIGSAHRFDVGEIGGLPPKSYLYGNAAMAEMVEIS